jgi:hypothetical protein
VSLLLNSINKFPVHSEASLMTDIPPSMDDEEDEGDKQSSVLSPQLVAAKSSLLERCKAAGLKVEDKFLPGEELQVLRVFMKCGRETRTISLYSEVSLVSFLSVPFEKYVFMSGMESICSYDGGTIEAEVRPISGSLYTWRAVFGVNDEAGLKSAKLVVSPGSEGLPRIELSRASALFSTILRGTGRIRRVTLKLSGVGVKTHDAALELLNKVAGSLFLQLDMLLGIPLTLERERRRPPLRKKRTAGAVEDLQYPRVQYDSAPLSLYWYGRSAEGMPLLQYLAFYQAIEFYFPVYSRSEAQRKLKVILKDPTFRSDRDADIARLLSAIHVSRTGAFGDERSQLRATLMECCDSEELRSFLEAEQGRKEFF